MTALREHMRRAGERALEALPAPLRPEIYLISFRIWRHDSWDYRHPYLAIGYNTESEVRRAVAAGGEPGEVRWSYAYWPLDETAGIVGHGPEPADDPLGAALHLAEIRELALWYEDESADEDEQDRRDELLTTHFDDACVDLARHLHASGKLTEILGRPVPVLPFDMYRAGYEPELAEAANPPEVVADYLAWARAQEE
ncbi:hypothetical protein [Streptomyces niveus]|uniref:hypothetical protein n=1 Tax=Streptomyces niveus TaxID=193462 RepID=UPI0033D80536